MSNRYGGNSKGMKSFKDDWTFLKSSSGGVTAAPTDPKALDYSKSKGIWSLKSTTAFPKR